MLSVCFFLSIQRGEKAYKVVCLYAYIYIGNSSIQHTLRVDVAHAIFYEEDRMSNITLDNVMLLWNRGGKAAVIDHPGMGRRRDLKMSACACYAGWDKLSKNEKVINIMSEALSAIVRDGADSRSVVEAILSVSEVKEVLPEDILQ